MKTLYLDCGRGISGDMLAAAVFALLEDKNKYNDLLSGMGMSGTEAHMCSISRYGIDGFSLEVSCKEARMHEHTTLGAVCERTEKLMLPEKVKHDITEVYKLIARAEGRVHGAPPCEVHFHEVGSKRAHMGIASACLALYMLGADEICASPVNAGGGRVSCAHGVLDVPAPASAELLKDIPHYISDTDGELCTPSGAALAKYFCKRFGAIPELKGCREGFGIGKRDFGCSTALRAVLG